MLTEDPSVTTWRLCLAPRPRPEAVGRHWWRDLVTETYRAARDAREALRESGHLVDAAHAAGADVSAFQLEPADFDAAYPPVRLADVMRGLSSGRVAPDHLEAW